jgi:beta-N-acetylhexosaminidase
MTAHVVYTALDRTAPATTSRRVIRRIIRGAIGFDGLLFSDDLSMQALAGTLGERAAAAMAAGCDVALHCNGKMEEMLDIAGRVPALAGKARRRADAALARLRHAPEPIDVAEARARLEDALLAVAA